MLTTSISLPKILLMTCKAPTVKRAAKDRCAGREEGDPEETGGGHSYRRYGCASQHSTEKVHSAVCAMTVFTDTVQQLF